MVLRRGDTKRLDLYYDFIRESRANGKDWYFAVITPDDEISEVIKLLTSECHLRPTIDEMARIYARSKLFLMLSEHEGFGLPPLEAMGAGCIPICRDSGGVRAYVTDDLVDLLVPLDWRVDKIIDFSDSLLKSKNLLRYSNLAKEIFESGLNKTTHRAQILLNLNLVEN
jgi:glycosyltransferase involved in cell wall biosynthesis